MTIAPGTIRAFINTTTKVPTVQVQEFKHNQTRGDSYWVTVEWRTFKTKALAEAYAARKNAEKA